MDKKKIAVYLSIGVGVLVFWSQIARVLTFIRTRITGKVVTTDVMKKVAAETGSSVKTISSTVRQEYCKGVAGSVFAMLHEKPLGFLPRSWFGSVENEAGIIKELNTLQSANEARFVSSYYFEKYSERLKTLLVKYLSTSDMNEVRMEIKNALS